MQVCLSTFYQIKILLLGMFIHVKIDLLLPTSQKDVQKRVILKAISLLRNGLPDEWDKTAEILRKTAEIVLGVTFGKRKGDRETWWWNEEIQESIKGKKKAKKAWDKIRDENTKKIYNEGSCDGKGTCV